MRSADFEYKVTQNLRSVARVMNFGMELNREPLFSDVLDSGDSMGGLGDGNALQTFSVGFPIYATSAFWNNSLYLAPAGGALRAYAFDPGSDRLNAVPSSQSPSVFAWPGSTPAVSASGSSNAIVWGLDTSRFCAPSAKCGPAVLHAYNATALGVVTAAVGRKRDDTSPCEIAPRMTS